MVGENEHELGVELGGFGFRKAPPRLDQRAIGGIRIGESAKPCSSLLIATSAVRAKLARKHQRPVCRHRSFANARTDAGRDVPDRLAPGVASKRCAKIAFRVQKSSPITVRRDAVDTAGLPRHSSRRRLDTDDFESAAQIFQKMRRRARPAAAESARRAAARRALAVPANGASSGVESGVS